MVTIILGKTKEIHDYSLMIPFIYYLNKIF